MSELRENHNLGRSCSNERQKSNPKWDAACLKYFKFKYRQRLERSRWQSEPFNKLFEIPTDPAEAKYPLPQAVRTDEIMPNLLNDRLFYLAFFRMEHCRSADDSFECFLWEMFGTNPGYLLEFCFLAGLHNFSAYSRFLGVISYLHSIGLEKPASFEKLLHDIETRLARPNLVLSSKSRLQQFKDRLLELRQEFFRFDLDAAWKQEGRPVYDYPLRHGLQHYLQINKELLRSVLKYSLDQLPALLDFSIRTSNTLLSSANPPGPGFVKLGCPAILYFDTAGTGKTTTILDKVRQNFGFYCVSPNLSPSDIESSDSVIAPDRAWASRDTYSIYKDFQALEKLNLSSQRLQMINEWDRLRSKPMEAARYHLLGLYKAAKSGNARTKWLQLQVSCWLGNDPFDVAYRFFRLQSMKEIDQNIPHRAVNQQALWAFDEAQQALEDPLATDIMVEMVYSTGINRTLCLLSGTSLELRKMEDVLGKVPLAVRTVHGGKSKGDYVLDEAKFLEIIGSHAWSIIKEVHALQMCRRDRCTENFPLLSRGGKALGFNIQLPRGGWLHVERSLQEWHVVKLVMRKEQEQSKDFTDFLKQVKKTHTMLVGRLRWTTLFAEELLRDSPAKEGKLTAQDVENACQRAATRIKRSLRDRIDELKHTHWVDELYWTAIEADVFSMTRIFSDEESAKLVSEGFALVDETEKRSINEGGKEEKRIIVKGRLLEPLAVKAVMEYLRDSKNGELYEKLINRFFNSLQLDRGQGGALGKLAEYVFAAKLDNFLRDTNDEIAMHRRNNFLNVLKTAEGRNRGDAVGNKINDIEKYFLVDPDVQQKPHDRMNTQKWLTGPRPSNFLFPTEEDGPDLLVFLKIPGTWKRILCAIQFKTGISGPAENDYIRHALHTLALKPWKPANYKCHVIHIYVASAVNIEASKFQNCLEWKGEGDKGNEER